MTLRSARISNDRGRGGKRPIRWVCPAWLRVAGVCVLLLLFVKPVLANLWQVYTSNSDYSHGVLIPVAAGVMAWQRRKWFAGRPAGARWPGLLLLLPGCAAVLLGHWYETALNPGYLGHVFLSGVGMILCIWGLTRVFLGSSGARAMLFPLCFLFLALPLPESVVTPLTLPLQRVVAAASEGILRRAGVAVFRDGNVLHLAKGVLGVNEACSGIRSLWVFLAVAAALIGLLRPSLLRIALMLVAAPALAVGANLLRVVVTGLILASGREAFAQGGYHTALGFLTVAIVGTVFLLLSGVRQRGSRTEGEGAAATPPRQVWREGGVHAAVAACLLLTACVASAVVEHHYRDRQVLEDVIVRDRRPLSEFPAGVGPYALASSGGLKPGERRVLAPADELVAEYRGAEGERVFLTLLYWYPRRLAPGTKESFKFPHSPDWCYPGAGWQRIASSDRDLDVPWTTTETVSVRRFTKEKQTRTIVFWRDHGSPGPHAFFPKALKRRFAALVRSWTDLPTVTVRGRYSVVVSVDGASGGNRAESTALDFAGRIAPLLPEYGFGRGRDVRAAGEL
ncbi:exosortase/archaeosortase family protein [Verrucomicrobiota bacterium]